MASIEESSSGSLADDARSISGNTLAFTMQFSIASRLRFRLSRLLPDPFPNGLISAKSHTMGSACRWVSVGDKVADTYPSAEAAVKVGQPINHQPQVGRDSCCPPRFYPLYKHRIVGVVYLGSEGEQGKKLAWRKNIGKAWEAVIRRGKPSRFSVVNV